VPGSAPHRSRAGDSLQSADPDDPDDPRETARIAKPPARSAPMQRHPEHQYLDLVRQILDSGDRRIDRTGVGTLAVFGALLRFDVARAAPVLTTKRVYWKTAVKEMLWFLTGGTNIRELLQANVRIWTDWPLARYRRATGEAIDQDAFERRVLDDAAFAREWGELGPVYGKQWRRWLGPDGREHDQIATLVDTIRTNPASRRMLFHAWNVAEIDEMALPPCHMVYQYHVANGRLSCLLFQRSVDVVLGLPFNLVGATALLAMLAQQCDLEPGELVWTGGDVHVYANHVEQARLQLTREPRPFPTLRLARRPAAIDGYRIEDFELDAYDPHPPIKADVAV
jgi:thymidylate synthase